MRMYEIIRKKREGKRLSDDEIKFFVDGYTGGLIPDYQASALLMAICIRGMDEGEIYALTLAMAKSGDMLDLSCFGGLSVDKHSSGGVGDKTTLIVAPIAAALGCKVAKMSGRGLGHTGGTIDKLESIGGYKTAVSEQEFYDIAQRVGVCVVGQSANLAPADKKLYALRDVTATVDSIPLIASSIMSKKLAAGSHSIVLDVKCGSGAFMKTEKEALELARCMTRIGAAAKRNVSAFITDMNTPLGSAVGNSLEVKEAVDVLRGDRSAGLSDLREICIALSAKMVSLARGIGYADCVKMAAKALDDMSAYRKFEEWICAQGGSIGALESFPTAKFVYEVPAARQGYIANMNCELIGDFACMLGAGRKKKDDIIDLSAGIIISKKTGDYVSLGDTVAYIHASDESLIKNVLEAYDSAITYSDTKPIKSSLIYEVVE